MTADRRLLFVHAHPDDEAIPTGATMARYAAEGAYVALVTCTLGEEGEIVADDLRHLAAAHADELGAHRRKELAAACAELGVTDFRFLGAVGRWRDSGMMGTPANDNPACFWRADPADVAEEMARILREVRPHVVVTYDENGDYGHPDHIQAHRATLAGVEVAADPSRLPDAGEPWQVPKVYYTATPKSLLRAGFEYFKERDEPGGFFAGVSDPDDLPFGVPDEVVTTAVDARAYVDRKLAAMRAHRSQIAPDGIFFALPDDVAVQVWGYEHYVLVRGETGGPRDADGRETDLFGGVPAEVPAGGLTP